jgi:hypothetical protein
MKLLSTLIILLTLICPLQFYSQRLKVKNNAKGLSLKITELKTIDNNGKSSWTCKSTLSNHSRDTLFYFITLDCEPADFLIWTKEDSIQLYSDFENCDTTKQTVITVLPSGQRTVNFKFSSIRPVSSSFKIVVYLWLHKANNIYERIPNYVLMKNNDRSILLKSKRIKIKTPAGNKGP